MSTFGPFGKIYDDVLLIIRERLPVGVADDEAGVGLLIAAALTVLQKAPQVSNADVLLVHGLPPDSDFRFKHALIQTRQRE